jgi:hypothetical protein
VSGYVKLYEEILDSSIWLEDHATRIVWITMLAMGGKRGIVSASVSGLARRANCSREECLRALQVLSSPDPDSRNGDYEGRRIAPTEGGWTILNHPRFRERKGDPESPGAKRTRKWRDSRAKEETTDQSHDPTRDASQAPVTPGDASLGISQPSPRHSGDGVGVGSGDVCSEGGAGGTSSTAPVPDEPPTGKVPCPPDLVLTDPECAQLEQSPGIPRHAIERATPWARARFASQAERPLGAWRRSLITTLTAWWNDPKKRDEMLGKAPPPRHARASPLPATDQTVSTDDFLARHGAKR